MSASFHLANRMGAHKVWPLRNACGLGRDLADFHLEPPACEHEQQLAAAGMAHVRPPIPTVARGIGLAPAKRLRTSDWRSSGRASISLRAAPLVLACALPICAMAFLIERAFDYFNQVGESSRMFLIPGVEHALAAVHASMVELPNESEARALSQRASSARMVLLANRRLAATVDRLEAQYGGFTRRYDAHLTEQQENVDRMRGELRRLQDQQDAIATQVRSLMMIGRDSGVKLQDIERLSGIEGRHQSELANKQSLSVVQPQEYTALRIARLLEKTRREAILLKMEQVFVIDFRRRIFGTYGGTELVQLDPVLDFTLDIASSEAINEHSGRIRFFPDGSSTGGRIHVRHDRGGAIVKVDWATGATTVQVLGD
jgi:general secretion pathway protein H